MPVEVSLVSHDGIPEDALFSIRAGSVRRQAAISTGKPFRFPKIGIEDSPVKIDILQTIGTAYLVIKPGEERYQAIFQGKTGNDMACEVDLRNVEGDVAPDEPESKDAGDNAKAYLDKHSILPFVQAVLQTVIKEQPEDPYAHMARHFLCGYDITDNRSPVLTRRLTASTWKGASTAQLQQEEVPVKQEEPVAPEAADAAQEVVGITAVAAAAEAVEEAAGDDAAFASREQGGLDTAADAFVIAATDGRLGAALESVAPAMEAGVEFDKLRLQMRTTFEEAQQNGCLLEALQTTLPDPNDPHAPIRAKMRNSLTTAQSDGRLNSILTSVCGAEAP